MSASDCMAGLGHCFPAGLERPCSCGALLRWVIPGESEHWRQDEDRWRMKVAAALVDLASSRPGPLSGSLAVRAAGDFAEVRLGLGGRPVAILVALAADRAEDG